MPREYRRIGQYEKEIIKFEEKGLTKREIGEEFGISKDREKGVLQMKRRREEKKREDKKENMGSARRVGSLTQQYCCIQNGH